MVDKSKQNQIKELAEELDMFDTMLSSLVELLEEKGIITQKDWENRIRHKCAKNAKFISFRDLGNVDLKKDREQ